MFEHHHLSPQQAILLLRGLAKGESTRVLASEWGLAYSTVLTLRHRIQGQALRNQTEEPLPDKEVEADEMFQNAGEKKESPIEIRTILLGDEATVVGVMAPTRTTARLSWEW